MRFDITPEQRQFEDEFNSVFTVFIAVCMQILVIFFQVVR